MEEWINGLGAIKGFENSKPTRAKEYAVANNIDDDPAFNWWVRDAIKRHDKIISKFKAKYWLMTHKFGIRIPKTVEEAYQIDKEAGTDYWTKAIAKKMKNVQVTFKKIPNVSVKQKIREGKTRIQVL